MGNFSDIYGYETIKEHLQSAISMGKVSHAYVISGGLGSGKKLIASTFAQTLQCEAGGVEPCGVCHSCVQAAGRNQPDIIWVGHEKPGSIGVDDIRTSLYRICRLSLTAVLTRYTLLMKQTTYCCSTECNA